MILIWFQFDAVWCITDGSIPVSRSIVLWTGLYLNMLTIFSLSLSVKYCQVSYICILITILDYLPSQLHPYLINHSLSRGEIFVSLFAKSALHRYQDKKQHHYIPPRNTLPLRALMAGETIDLPLLTGGVVMVIMCTIVIELTVLCEYSDTSCCWCCFHHTSLRVPPLHSHTAYNNEEMLNCCTKDRDNQILTIATMMLGWLSSPKQCKIWAWLIF